MGEIKEKKTRKSQVGKVLLIRKAQNGQEAGEKQKINHCNYIQERRGGLGQQKKQIMLEQRCQPRLIILLKGGQ